MQAPYKEQKASNAVHLPFYWNVLSFSFTIIEFSLDINFRVVMQPTFPLEKGRKRGDYLYRTDIVIELLFLQQVFYGLFYIIYFLFRLKTFYHPTLSVNQKLGKVPPNIEGTFNF